MPVQEYKTCGDLQSTLLITWYLRAMGPSRYAKSSASSTTSTPRATVSAKNGKVSRKSQKVVAAVTPSGSSSPEPPRSSTPAQEVIDVDTDKEETGYDTEEEAAELSEMLQSFYWTGTDKYLL